MASRMSIPPPPPPPPPPPQPPPQPPLLPLDDGEGEAEVGGGGVVMARWAETDIFHAWWRATIKAWLSLKHSAKITNRAGKGTGFRRDAKNLLSFYLFLDDAACMQASEWCRMHGTILTKIPVVVS